MNRHPSDPDHGHSITQKVIDLHLPPWLITLFKISK